MNAVKTNNAHKSFEELMGREYEGVRGQAAVELLVQEKQGRVKDAFYRDDIGGIDLFWGDDFAGLCHIIKNRKARGEDPKKILALLTRIVEKGTLVENQKYRDRINVAYDNKVAVISFELRKTETTAILTAFQK